ncbi:hypothetical protein GCM10029963_68910 [Micromonospora andamanensis]
MINKMRELDRSRVNALHSVADRWKALPKWQRSLAFVAFVVFLYYLPLLGIPGLTWLRTDSISGGSNWAGVLFTCAVYVLVAIGLNVVIGLAGLLDLGYIGFFAIGAYAVALFGSVNSLSCSTSSGSSTCRPPGR